MLRRRFCVCVSLALALAPLVLATRLSHAQTGAPTAPAPSGAPSAPPSANPPEVSPRPPLVPERPAPGSATPAAGAAPSADRAPPAASTASPLTTVNPARDQQELAAQGASRPGADLPGRPQDIFSDDWWGRARPIIELHGYFRTRAELFHNFFLGRHGSTVQGN